VGVKKRKGLRGETKEEEEEEEEEGKASTRLFFWCRGVVVVWLEKETKEER
jgi:hypothetical protein